MGPSMKIRLDEQTHQYFVDAEDGFGEQEKRSWSAISHDAGLADDLSGVPAHWLHNARARGSQIHDAVALIIQNDEEQLNANILNLDEEAFDAWEKDTE